MVSAHDAAPPDGSAEAGDDGRSEAVEDVVVCTSVVAVVVGSSVVDGSDVGCSVVDRWVVTDSAVDGGIVEVRAVDGTIDALEERRGNVDASSDCVDSSPTDPQLAIVIPIPTMTQDHRGCLGS